MPNILNNEALGECNFPELHDYHDYHTPNKQLSLINSFSLFSFSAPLGPQLMAPPTGLCWAWQLGLFTSLTIDGKNDSDARFSSVEYQFLTSVALNTQKNAVFLYISQHELKHLEKI